MRIAGGVLLLLFGLWNLVAGGCQAGCGGVVSKGSELGYRAVEKATEQPGSTLAPEAKRALAEARRGVARVGAAGTGMLVSGLVIFLSGVLCIVAGILLLADKGKVFGFLAPGVAIVGEVLSLAMGVSILWWSVLKILVFGFAGFTATRVGREGG